MCKGTHEGETRVNNSKTRAFQKKPDISTQWKNVGKKNKPKENKTKNSAANNLARKVQNFSSIQESSSSCHPQHNTQWVWIIQRKSANV